MNASEIDIDAATDERVRLMTLVADAEMFDPNLPLDIRVGHLEGAVMMMAELIKGLLDKHAG